MAVLHLHTNTARLHTATVEYNHRLKPGLFLLALLNTELATQSLPAQFLTIKVGDTHSPLLRRPFSIFNASKIAGMAPRVEILYKVVGQATRIMSHLKAGDQVSILGPLGKPYPIEGGSPLLIGGGTGIASLHFLARRLIDKRIVPKILFGARTEDELIPLPELGRAEIHFASEDGTVGFAGDVVTLAKEHLPGAHDAVYACGPREMLSALKEVIPSNLPCFVSLEETMACGVGACLGCSVQLGDGSYATVCRQGAVFRIEELRW